jgi:transcriptional regulator with XRE-family HTH domain
VVDRFEAERVRSPMVANRISKAVAAAMKDSGLSREQIAESMSVELEESVTAGTLTQYSSEANQRNNIPAHRLIALAKVTRDARLLNAALEGTGLIAVDARYEPLLCREVRKEQLKQLLEGEIKDFDEQWRATK